MADLSPHRSATSGIAESAVRQVNEGTSSLQVQSPLNERWWREVMDCYCYLTPIQDFFERRENTLWKKIQ